MPHRRCRKSSAMFLCGVLVLFLWQSAIYPVRGQTRGEPIKEAAAKVEQTRIVIQKGDTLWSLAQKYQLSLEQLTRLNHITYPDHIRVGQKLLIQAQPSILTQPQTPAVQVQSARDDKTFEIMMEDSVDQESEKVSENSVQLVHPSRGQQDQQQVTNKLNTEEQTSKVKASQAEIDLLARVIYAEARGEDFEGQVAVGAVVLNRLENSGFPKTIHDIVYQPGAFTAVIDKQIHLIPDEEAYRAAETALAGKDPTGGALYYFNPKTATDRWIKSRAVIKQIGNHTFSI